MTVPEGEFFGFLGPNGAGKTTTIEVFARSARRPAARFGSTASTSAQSHLLVALRDSGLTVVGFNVRAPPLDDVFLATTGEELDTDEAADARVEVSQ